MQFSVWSPCLLAVLLLYGVLPVTLTQAVKNASNRTNVILIGHIGAIGALPNYEKILDLARQELLSDGTLGDDFDIEIISRNGCGEAFEGVAAAADLYHIEHINTFLGPYCNAGKQKKTLLSAWGTFQEIVYLFSSLAL
ncbi:hypothetical protein OSTOST_01732 [Ostertagia ostertagi]